MTELDATRALAAAEADYRCAHDDRSGYHSGESGLRGDLIFAGAPPDVIDKVPGWVRIIERQAIECLREPDRPRPEPPYPRPKAKP